MKPILCLIGFHSYPKDDSNSKESWTCIKCGKIEKAMVDQYEKA